MSDDVLQTLGDFAVDCDGSGEMSTGRIHTRLGDSLRMMNVCERSGSRKSTLSRSQPFQFVPCFEQSRATAVPRDSSRQLQAATGPNATGREPRQVATGPNATGPRTRQVATGPPATGPRTRQARTRQVRERDRRPFATGREL